MEWLNIMTNSNKENTIEYFNNKKCENTYWTQKITINIKKVSLRRSSTIQRIHFFFFCRKIFYLFICRIHGIDNSVSIVHS